MNLDKRIPQGFKEPFSILSYKGAEQYIGELCWFSNYVDQFRNVNNFSVGYLINILPTNSSLQEKIFECGQDNKKEFYRYCIPCCFESPYRPFSSAADLIEHDYDVGKVITWREKGYTSKETISMITRIDVYKDDSTYIQLGSAEEVNLKNAYKRLEIKVNGKWIPFGVKKDV